MARAYWDIQRAVLPEGDAARASLMAAAFAGGAAIHKGLGPAHAVALAFGDQELHHGTLVAAALPLTVALVAPHAPAKASRVAAALELRDVGELSGALRTLVLALGLPTSLRAAGYRTLSIDPLVDMMEGSAFNRSSPYAPTRSEYAQVALELLA
jgi:alcohol dehydrogenase class IV